MPLTAWATFKESECTTGGYHAFRRHNNWTATVANPLVACTEMTKCREARPTITTSAGHPIVNVEWTRSALRHKYFGRCWVSNSACRLHSPTTSRLKVDRLCFCCLIKQWQNPIEASWELAATVHRLFFKSQGKNTARGLRPRKGYHTATEHTLTLNVSRHCTCKLRITNAPTMTWDQPRRYDAKSTRNLQLASYMTAI